MATILQTLDFKVGKLKIEQGQNSDLSTYITNDFENGEITGMLGLDLGNLFIADLASDPLEPQSAEYIKIFNQFQFESDGVAITCKGIKEILKDTLFVYYAEQQFEYNSASGNVTLSAEASEKSNSKLIRYYNEIVMQRNYLAHYVEYVAESDYSVQAKPERLKYTDNL